MSFICVSCQQESSLCKCTDDTLFVHRDDIEALCRSVENIPLERFRKASKIFNRSVQSELTAFRHRTTEQQKKIIWDLEKNISTVTLYLWQLVKEGGSK